MCASDASLLTPAFSPCRLVEMGFEKMVNELDVKEAARLGMHTKPLTVAQVQKHLEDLGIDPEFGTHSHIRGLSGALAVTCRHFSVQRCYGVPVPVTGWASYQRLKVRHAVMGVDTVVSCCFRV